MLHAHTRACIHVCMYTLRARARAHTHTHTHTHNTSRKFLRADANLCAARWWGSRGDGFISNVPRSAVHVPLRSLAAPSARGGAQHVVERTRDGGDSERGRVTSELAPANEGGVGQGPGTEFVAAGCAVPQPADAERVAGGEGCGLEAGERAVGGGGGGGEGGEGGGGEEGEDRFILGNVGEEEVERVAGLDAFLWEAAWLHFGNVLLCGSGWESGRLGGWAACLYL